MTGGTRAFVPELSLDMGMEFWDCNCFVGEPMVGIHDPAATATELLEAMDTAGISRALVWHTAQFDCSAQDGNALASEAVTASDRLFGCWAIMPPVTEETPTETLFADMKRNRIAALRVFPDQNRFFLNRVVFGPLLDEVSARRIPVLFSIEKGTTWAGIYAALADFPNLTCILCDIGTWGQDRHIWPLLQAYPNVHVETSYLALEAGGIAATVNRFGAERVVFGTGYPLRYAEAPMMAVLHADISDDDKHKIALQNLDRLIQGARL